MLDLFIQVLITDSIVHYYASWMEPTSAAHILQQSDELQRLTKELDKCRADKEFVWGLWKKLQKTNPDLNAAIEMVVAREKSSHQQKLDQLLAYGQEKESHFEKISEETQQLNTRLEEESNKLELTQSENLQLCNELSALQCALSSANQRVACCEEMERKHRSMETELEVLQQQLSTQELAFKSQVTEMSNKIRNLAAENRSLSTRAVQAETGGREMQEKLNEFGEQLRAVRDECNQRVEATRNLDQLLSSKGEELEIARRDKEDMSSRLFECVAEEERHKLCANETRTLSNRLQSNLKEREEQLIYANSLNQMLNNKVSECAREISHLKEHMKELESFKIHTAQQQRSEAYTQTGPLTQATDSTTVVVQLLESKSIETDQLRKSHDRRLQRYKELQTTNKLLRDQLSTYAPDSIPPIQHQEEVERVLNETPVGPVTAQSSDTYAEVLKKFRSTQEENARLTGTIFSIEETLDELRCEKVRLESAVSELMYSAEQNRASIIARLSSLRSIGSDTNLSSNGGSEGLLEGKFSLELRLGELEECLLNLETDRNEWTKEHHKLISEYDQLAAEMEQCNLELEQKDIILCERENEINLLKRHTSNSTQHKHTCTSPNTTYTRSVSVQTAQQLLLKHYPPLRHAYTQTAPASTAETPTKQRPSSEVKSLQKRISSLNRQVEVLSETRNHFKSCLEEEQEKTSEIEVLLNDTLYKLKVSRAENCSLSSEALILRQTNAVLEESLQTGSVERESETSALFSRLEARLRSSSEECSKQAGTLYRLNRELQEKRSELDSLSNCSLRKEREHKQNIAQKRHLLDDMREQTHKLKANVQSNEELIRKQAAELKRLTDANASVNNRNTQLKEQVVRVSQEREVCMQELQQAKQALVFHTQQLNMSQTECSRKIQLLKVAKTQIDHLSELFGEEEDYMRSADLEKQLSYTTACIVEHKQTVLCLSELVWCRKFNRQGSGRTKDILSLSAQEMLEIAKHGATAVTPVWTDSNQYLQIVSVLEKPPPFALRLAELILSILDL